MIEYGKCDILELVRAVKNGDDDACEELLLRYSPLINSIVSKTISKMRYADDEEEKELRQEAAIKLYQAALAYDENRSETSFGLYAKICIGNRMNSVLRRMRTVSDEIPTETIDIDELDEAVDDDMSEILIDRERICELDALIRSHLSQLEYSVYSLYIEDYSADEISKRLNISRVKARNAIYRMKTRIQKILDNKEI